MTSVRALTLCLFAAAAAAFADCARPSGPIEIRIAVPRDGINWLPVVIAQAHGYDREEGLSLRVSDVAGMSKGIEALVGGSVDVTAGTLSQAIQVAVEGAEVRCFMTLSKRAVEALAVTPSMTGTIRDVGSLRGRRVGVSAPGSATHQFLNAALVAHGLSPDAVSVVSIGAGATSVAALIHAKVDAAVLVGSAITTIERASPSVPILVDTRRDADALKVFGTGTYPATSLIAQDRWLNANADTVRRLVRAVQKATAWLSTHSAEQVREEMPDYLRMPDADADVQAIRTFQQFLSPDGAMPDEAPEVVRKFVALSNEKVRNTHIDLSKLYTNQFVTTR
jgi:sulfonate transport system substrate-binding protein